MLYTIADHDEVVLAEGGERVYVRALHGILLCTIIDLCWSAKAEWARGETDSMRYSLRRADTCAKILGIKTLREAAADTGIAPASLAAMIDEFEACVAVAKWGEARAEEGDRVRILWTRGQWSHSDAWQYERCNSYLIEEAADEDALAAEWS